MQQIRGALLILIISLSSACSRHPLNDPYPKREATANIYYGSFSERPKTLDPARSYAANETIFTAQIYQPPLQYHYLLRPYTLVPLAASTMPSVQYRDKNGQILPGDPPASAVAESIYTISIRPHQFYQDHPALAVDKNGKSLYLHLTAAEIDSKESLRDFAKTGTREVTADDYVYEIKRLASPQLQSPIFGLMSHYIRGMEKFNTTVAAALDKMPEKSREKQYIDLRTFPFDGLKTIDRYSYEIHIEGKYPQFLYWLAMPFFAPIPWEADRFYQQPGMSEHDLSLDWFPLGSGPYQLTENNPSREMILKKNPYFQGETYPTEGETGDRSAGYLLNAGKVLPLIDEFIFTLETESIPRWSKFLQGYYDASGISNDSFDQAIRVDEKGNADLTPEMTEKGIRLEKTVDMSTYYFGFNMKDPVVGGNSARSRYLRQAISIALDYEDFIALFLNGRGIVAQSPMPPGIFGYGEGQAAIDPYVYRWSNGEAQRLPIAIARELMIKAGYPNGHDPKTGDPLVLDYDTVSGGAADDKERIDWLQKQFSKIGIQIQVRGTTYNRFQEKIRTGDVQMFMFGWNADYPDPENFLFLLYGPNGKVDHGGENAVNYHNAEYDQLFDQMKNLPNTPVRAAMIQKMIRILQYDAPWVFGFHALNFSLTQQWDGHHKPNAMANNTLKYYSINPQKREEMRQAWNKPVWWPVWILLFVVALAISPVLWFFYQKEYRNTMRRYHD